MGKINVVSLCFVTAKNRCLRLQHLVAHLCYSSQSNDCLNWSSDPYESQPLWITFKLKTADLILQQWSAATIYIKRYATEVPPVQKQKYSRSAIVQDYVDTLRDNATPLSPAKYSMQKTRTETILQLQLF